MRYNYHNEHRLNRIEKAILQTVIYSDIFHFPLTMEELWQYLISGEKISYSVFEKSLSNLSPTIVQKQGYYCLSESTGNIARRRKNIPQVQKKLKIAKRAAYYLSYIPTISLIGLSGGVAIGNAEEDDDIDFFIITKKNTLFMTRLWIQAVLEMLTLRRKRESIDVANKICVNLLIDETKVAWSKKKHDIYTAHEIVQMKPLFERNEMYKRFLERNSWVHNFFPNALLPLPQVLGNPSHRKYYTLQFLSFFCNLPLFEGLVRQLQTMLIKRHKTVETVSQNILAFHPTDYRMKTLETLNAKSRQFGLLTNN